MATQDSAVPKVLGKYFTDTGELRVPVDKIKKAEYLVEKAKTAILLVRAKQSGKINSGVSTARRLRTRAR